MFEQIKNWWVSRKAKIHQLREERIAKELCINYNVVERHGYLYLVVGDRAVSKIDNTVQVSKVIEMIKKARAAQIDFIKNEI